jgi:hypothetical protein
VTFRSELLGVGTPDVWITVHDCFCDRDEITFTYVQREFTVWAATERKG